MNTALYSLIPRRITTKIMFFISKIENPWIKNIIIYLYIFFTKADTSFAKIKNPYDYNTLNDFFTRSLAENVRPVDTNNKVLSSPVDGRCATWQKISHHTVLQAKNINYSAEELLGDTALAQHYINGETATLYLAPDDYHRIHMPYDGTLLGMRFCPGDKHSVALKLLDKIPNIFAGNERVILWFNTDFGLMTLVLVGALNVSSIETIWHGIVRNQTINTYDYSSKPHHFAKGEEIARFNLGSTVILFFPENTITWDIDALRDHHKILMGQKIATRNT